MTKAQTFDQFFQKATGGREAYPFQNRFANAAQLPHLVRAPTGAGKTATAVLGWLWRWTHRLTHTPRRLVYCLPMRVLVEQSERETRGWLTNLGLAENVETHVLMGGVEADAWFLHPEKPMILIGTQDMLLSRALNRGYAASRFHWPIDFGLLNNDCLWIFDEPQLMGSGVSTSAQLAGLRHSLATSGACASVWMSATLEPSWLDTIDFKGKFSGEPLELDEKDYDPTKPLFKRMTAEKTLRPLGVVSSRDMKDAAKAVLENHVHGTQTLVVVNTVDRAKSLFDKLAKLRKKNDTPKLLLVHSRFRPTEREQLNQELQDKDEMTKDRIIVATQVVEAGVDISSRTLITEIAPWASIVQRIGRCNRTGDDGPGQVFWIELDEKLAPPYESRDLNFARKHLTKLEDKSVSPRALDEYKRENEKPDEVFLRFEHKHVLRRRDLLDLFDTSPDLSGNDIDIQRFVRGDDPQMDVQVFWRPAAPRNDWVTLEQRRQAARREELCNVPIGSFKKDFLETGKMAYRFDHLDGEWRMIAKNDARTVIPGQTFWIVADQGGYDPLVGWSPASGPLADELLIPLPIRLPKSRYQRPEGFYDSDEWAQQREWRTIAEHTDEVSSALNSIMGEGTPVHLSDSERAALSVAVRWHDWGKRHDEFQKALRLEIADPDQSQQVPPVPLEQRRKIPRPERWRSCVEIAKAPQEFWGNYTRKRLRHELASALGVTCLLASNRVPKDWSSLTADQQELALYLIAAHHGKVRLSIRAMPNEPSIPNRPNVPFASGIWENDILGAADLGGNVRTEEVELSLAPMQLGDDRSWTAMTLELLKRLGPFRLGYLEALMRAADCRASAGIISEGDADA